VREQYWPGAQLTPLQGTSKQPLMQCPSTHVFPLAQVTAAQRSSVTTQAALHVSPGHPVQVSVHALSWQTPWMQIFPPGQ
jgi:hypothetical protein